MRKTNIIKILGSVGGYFLARFICKYEPRVLMYHRFSVNQRKGFASEAVFEKQIRYIKKWYNPITMADLVSARFERRKIPPHSVVVTIDDGYEDFYRIAYPILRREGVPATFYVTTEFPNQEFWLWPDKVAWLLSEDFTLADDISLSGYTLFAGIYNNELRKSLYGKLVKYFLEIPNVEKNRGIEQLSTAINRSAPLSPPQEFKAVSWEQLQEMAEQGIEIGGHTATHPSLGQVGYDEAQTEITRSMADLREHLGEMPRTFCYPNGTPSDYQNFLPELVSAAGYTGACVAFPDRHGTKPRYSMRRHVSGDNMFQFLKSVSGVEYLGYKLGKST